MLIRLDYLVDRFGVLFTGILHVGAHECEEINDYEKYVSRDNILQIDALQDKVDLSKNRYPGLLIEQAVVSDVSETVTFNRSNNGQSSSFLELGTHKQEHPDIHYVETTEMQTTILQDILPKYNIPFNFVNLDIQGVELKALKGMSNYLDKIDYIYTEVNTSYLYKECALINEIDDFLKTYGFERVETLMTPHGWGDAFYLKCK